MPRVVIFAFYGRRKNVELQLPFIERILAEHPNASFDAWNFARDDNSYVRSLKYARNEFYDTYPQPAWNEVYRHYAKPEYEDCIFIKLDDDVPFLETERFEEFVKAIADNPGTIISAETVNNGASTPLEMTLWAKFKELGIPLLDVHLSNAYAAMSHRWFFDNWLNVIDGEVKFISTEDWVSINAIGFDHQAMKFIADNVGTPSPPHIAGRDWADGFPLGDEGACNMLPRAILQGFTAAHLTFGPQYCTDEQQDHWRAEYAKIAGEYLGN